MFKVHGNDIYINRGESATFTVMPYDDDGNPHVMEVGEWLRLTVRSRGFERWHIDSDKGYTTLRITSKETRCEGKFDYDVKLMYPDGSTATIIGATENFTPHFVVLEG